MRVEYEDSIISCYLTEKNFRWIWYGFKLPITENGLEFDLIKSRISEDHGELEIEFNERTIFLYVPMSYSFRELKSKVGEVIRCRKSKEKFPEKGLVLLVN